MTHVCETVPAPGAFLALLRSVLAVNLSKTHQFFGIQGLTHSARTNATFQLWHMATGL